MTIKIKQYKEHSLHSDLTPTEEMFLLFYYSEYGKEEIGNINDDLMDALGFSEQYCRKVTKALLTKGYLIRNEDRTKSIDIDKLNLDCLGEIIPTAFLETDSIETLDKVAIISIYKQSAGKDVISFKGMKLTISVEDAEELFERLLDTGYSSKGDTFDFMKLFKDESIYDL